ncbi:MAG: ABC transporter permease subunit [Spirochaetia bacterium]|nr:ABC transporter permease subunit [Spirochaetia bacterium]
MIAVYKKELKSYFYTPGAYIFMGAFLLIAGLLFSLQNVFAGDSNYAGFLSSLIFIFLLVVPILTMKLFTEEKRQKTDILLLSSPVSIIGIVLGKYLAAVTVFAATLLITMLYPLFLSFHGRMDWAQIWGTYIGFFFLGSAFIAIGTFLSEVAESQTSAAILTFCGLLASWIIDYIISFVPTSSMAGAIFILILAGAAIAVFQSKAQDWRISAAAAVIAIAAVCILYIVTPDMLYGLISKFIAWFSLTSRFQRFSMGILKLDAVIYYLSFSAFFLYVTGSRIENRRWS